MRRKLNYSLAALLILMLALPASSRRGEAHPGRKMTTYISKKILPPNIDLVPGIVNRDNTVKAGLLFDVAQNKIVWEKGMYTSFPIASLTKLMTALLVMEDIRDGKTGWDTLVSATPAASMVGSSKLWMKPGQIFSVGDLVKSCMICSANDACYLLGEHCSGTEKAFVERMNARANKLGMYNTFFSNSNGLPAGRREIDNFSSPSDLLILAREVLKFPMILQIASMDADTIFAEKQKFELKNHNKLTVDYPEVDGLKTGYTRKAGFCIVATAQREDTRLIGIVLGAPSPVQRNDFVAGLFNSYFESVVCVGKMDGPAVPVKMSRAARKGASKKMTRNSAPPAKTKISKTK